MRLICGAIRALIRLENESAYLEVASYCELEHFSFHGIHCGNEHNCLWSGWKGGEWHNQDKHKSDRSDSHPVSNYLPFGSILHKNMCNHTPFQADSRSPFLAHWPIIGRHRRGASREILSWSYHRPKCPRAYFQEALRQKKDLVCSSEQIDLALVNRLQGLCSKSCSCHSHLVRRGNYFFPHSCLSSTCGVVVVRSSRTELAQ
jgi:hypothetical protein